ncbi:MAG TPA: cellulose binding domain-containing protein, partial [Rugosimonospora sp.]|nr:cellulose binding domain-containing protein [Rugosimonospora sp.]
TGPGTAVSPPPASPAPSHTMVVAPVLPPPSTAAGARSQSNTGGTAPAPPRPVPTAAPPTCLNASHVLNTQWPGGLQAQFTVTNCGNATIDGWVVTVRFSGSVTIQSWNSISSGGSSTVDFGSVDYNTTVAPGASITFGFNATWSSGGTRAIIGCAVGYGSCS